jgi:hypothetical protein
MAVINPVWHHIASMNIQASSCLPSGAQQGGEVSREALGNFGISIFADSLMEDIPLTFP